jgi:hypothetical protein
MTRHMRPTLTAAFRPKNGPAVEGPWTGGPPADPGRDSLAFDGTV